MRRAGRSAIATSGGQCLRWVLACLLGLSLAVAAVDPASARKKKDKDEDEEEKIQYTLSEAMFKRLNEALELLQDEQFTGAREVLQSLEEKKRLNPYERALIFQMRGYVESGEENYQGAIEYLNKSLAEEALPKSQRLAMRFNVAQLHMALDQWQESVDTLQIWFREADKPTSIAYYLLAIAFYQVEDTRRALKAAERSVKIAPVPQESWLHLYVALLLEEKQYKETIPPLHQLVSLYPKTSYWNQLSAIYAHLDEEEKALAVLQLAYVQGMLEEDREVRRLGKLYLSFGLPYRAAVVLEKGLADEQIEPDEEAWNLLSTSWILAREYDRAEEPLGKAAELAETGELYVRLGQLFTQRYKFAEAVDALRKGLRKGQLDDIGNANLLLGICLYNQEKTQAARDSFAAARSSESSREYAERWLLYIESEEKRWEQLRLGSGG